MKLQELSKHLKQDAPTRKVVVYKDIMKRPLKARVQHPTIGKPNSDKTHVTYNFNVRSKNTTTSRKSSLIIPVSVKSDQNISVPFSYKALPCASEQAVGGGASRSDKSVLETPYPTAIVSPHSPVIQEHIAPDSDDSLPSLRSKFTPSYSVSDSPSSHLVISSPAGSGVMPTPTSPTYIEPASGENYTKKIHNVKNI